MKIKCQSLTYRYPGANQNVFEKINIDFPPHVTLLRGFSGCGKSTLLRLAVGFLQPTDGVVEVEGLLKPGSKEFFRKELSFVFQDLNLLPLASVGRNLRLSSQIAGTSSRRCRLMAGNPRALEPEGPAGGALVGEGSANGSRSLARSPRTRRVWCSMNRLRSRTTPIPKSQAAVKEFAGIGTRSA